MRTGYLHQPNKHPFVRKLESIALAPLSADERAALLALPMNVVEFDSNKDIVREGDRPSHSFAVLDGFVSVYKSTTAGAR